ncbi:unnamed protein product [Staurois parvus]|uniref:Uncharacterized protein n=1 Tax=Staurois parvus TaxID=386267 RepID=A0ABN9DDA1_9NEOB|nr:unnamed protein product [Staurois parvus]
MQSGKYCSPGNRQTQTRLLECQKHDLSLQRTYLHCSRVQWWLAELLLFPVASTVIIPQTGDLGIFSSKEISQMDLLNRWQHITVPRLHSLSS